jgi:hypothetical protein
MSRTLVVSGLIAILLSASAMSAPQSPTGGVRLFPAAGHIQLVDDSDIGAKKDDYLHKAGDQMREWRQKLHDFNEQAKADEHEARENSKADLNLAWSATQEKWSGLQAASADGWNRAKHAFESASAELKAKWHEVHPADE